MGKELGPAGHVCWVCGRRAGVAIEPAQPKPYYRCVNRNCHAILCGGCTVAEPFNGCPFCLSHVIELAAPNDGER